MNDNFQIALTEHRRTGLIEPPRDIAVPKGCRAYPWEPGPLAVNDKGLVIILWRRHLQSLPEKA